MAKSLRSKRKRKLRAVKREKNVVKEKARLIGILQSEKEDVEMEEEEEITGNEVPVTAMTAHVEKMDAVSKTIGDKGNEATSNTETSDVEMLTDDQRKKIANRKGFKKFQTSKHKMKRLASKKKRGKKIMKW